MRDLPDNGYHIEIGGEGKMFTLRKMAPYSNSDHHIQNLAHTWEEAEAKAFAITGFHLEAPAVMLNPLATQVTRGDATMPYGKYRGRLLTEVIEEDLGYLVWWSLKSKDFYESDPTANVKRFDRIVMELPEVLTEIECREKAKAEREAKWKAEAEAMQKSSRHLGTIGERMEFTGTVVFEKSFDTEYGVGFMTKVHTDDGCELMYWNIFGLDASELGYTHGKLDSQKGDRITFFAAVKDHSEYNGIKQTVIKRATRGKLLEAGKENAININRYA
jgi:uncharacterized protein (DUF3820 family)